MAGGFHTPGGERPRASQRRVATRPSTVPSPIAPAPGDRVTWGEGRFAGRFIEVGRDGLAELLCDATGRRWRLPLADLRRIR